ncbi:DUF262 domain-containing protein [Geobacter sp. AOG1]|uniref:DUF262 domain-containing protein n=1 Tax=Geobacter sp. AOG1 TaxID=1566346 RepID=UPI001CC6ADFD|nr:DUF262 domain-containing protein [Geobacter sp. AOG1]GFE56812.1 hypothetical protein AOG1_06910 [Geobacter sp. AOG1]
MNAHSMPFSKIISSDQGAREHYHIPKYQREYTWGVNQWDKLLQDVDENDQGYFMGSIICVNDGEPASPGDELIYQVVDGQQRLTTLALLIMAILQKLTGLKDDVEFEDEEERQDFENSLSGLRNKLLKKKKKGEYREGEYGGFIEQSKMCFIRVQPSFQNHNYDDYLYILSELGLIKTRPRPSYLGVRSMYKAFRYFQDNTPDEADKLLALTTKINQLTFVHISVGSQADAFTLFETLNNRGVPLSAIDIIKNKMLSEMERKHKVDIDESFEQWQEIINAIPDAGDQERFLRQFYNAFKVNKDIRIDGINRAVKSKSIQIYETLIKKDAKAIFKQLCDKALIYGRLLEPEFDNGAVDNALADLLYIGAAPAYQVLLYLFSLPKKSFSEADFLEKSVELFSKYYVRRNITDIPSTRDLDQAHIILIEKCHAKITSGEKLSITFLERWLLGRKGGDQRASLETFREELEGNLYSTNSGMCRYLLIKLDSIYHTREYRPDLWLRDDKDRFIWTVEHVFPKGENIPKAWVDMIANGNISKAEEILEEMAHCLGNLTLSGFNSKLAASPFANKQALVKGHLSLGHKINIGYRNGLALNNIEFKVKNQKMTLANAKAWKPEMIRARTKVMVDMLIKIYRFSDE